MANERFRHVSHENGAHYVVSLIPLNGEAHVRFDVSGRGPATDVVLYIPVAAVSALLPHLSDLVIKATLQEEQVDA